MTIEKIFKKIIYLQFTLFFLLLIKYYFFPNSIAPPDLSFAIKRYSEELMPEISYPIYLVFLIILIFNLFSLFKLFKFSNFWRQVYLFTFIFIMLFTFIEKFVYIDTLEVFLEECMTVSSTILLTMSYLPPLNKKFK